MSYNEIGCVLHEGAECTALLVRGTCQADEGSERGGVFLAKGVVQPTCGKIRFTILGVYNSPWGFKIP